MKKAYIILVHKNPKQLYRLIKMLDDELSHFFIHVDKRADIVQFNCLAHFKSKVEFITREVTEWGGFGLVNAVLNGLRAVRESKKNISHIILLSGQDYPIKSNQYINKFISENKNNFLEYFPLPNPQKWKPDGGMYRIDKYFFGLKLHHKYAAKTMNLMSRFFPSLRRKKLEGMKAHAGSMWWIIDKYSADYILDYVNNNPDYVAFHRHTFAPDELFFHTILLNAKDERISSSIINNNKRYIKWRDRDASHPETITSKYFDDMKASDALFARKFDLSTDSEVLNLIDENFIFIDGL